MVQVTIPPRAISDLVDCDSGFESWDLDAECWGGLVDDLPYAFAPCRFNGANGHDRAHFFPALPAGALPYTHLRDAVFAHSALAEFLNNLLTHFDS